MVAHAVTAPAAPALPGAAAQLRSLLVLRLAMVRSPRRRAGLVVLGLAVVAAPLASTLVGRSLPPETAFDLALLAPTTFLGFALLSVLSPLTAGGGLELYPPQQLAALPVRSRTHYLIGLAVVPLSLAWTSQLLALFAAAFLLVPPSGWTVAGVAVLLLFVLAVTTLGQALSWLTVGLRRSRRGRLAVLGAGALAGATVVAAVLGPGGSAVLDASPTRHVVLSVVVVAQGDLAAAWPVAPLLLVLVAAWVVAGTWLCGWAQRRPEDAAVSGESRLLRRRPDEAVTLVAVDRASVWRSPALRRGALVLGLLPGGIAGLLQVEWTTIVLLPGLVAAGAGLLFGVNAFCLDGTGAVWLASLPHDPARAVRAKTRALVETCLACEVITVAAAVARVEQAPTSAELVALLSALVLGPVSVAGACLSMSLRHPHRADLLGSRAAPAPPGAMAVYSLRLAVGSTLLGLLLAGSAAAGVWWLPALLTVPFLARSLRRVLAGWSQWASPAVRARVVSAVAYG